MIEHTTLRPCNKVVYETCNKNSRIKLSKMGITDGKSYWKSHASKGSHNLRECN
ncbi:MAG: hypothetical protein ACMUEK_01280 [Sodalis sp. (in: enterobacteria)]